MGTKSQSLGRVKLGRTGLEVSQLCLGTMVFGGPTVDELHSFELLDTAEELGFDFLDSADVYPVPRGPERWGKGEELVGRWLARSPGRRERFVVATKFGDVVGFASNQQGGSRKHVIEACEASLRRLDTDRIDLFWMHKPDPQTPMEETLEALDRLVQDGKVLYIGASNYQAWQLGLSIVLAGQRRTVRFAAVQPRWSLIERRAELDLVPLCIATGIAVVPYNPLAGGLLTGKYRRGAEPPEHSRFGQGDWGKLYQKRYWTEAAFDLIETLVAVATRNGTTPAQTALAWLLTRDGLTAPIIGATRPEQLKENLAALGSPFPLELMRELDEASTRFQ